MLLLITKSVGTLFRKFGCYKLLPLNYNVYFHRLMAVMILVLGLVHTIVFLSDIYVKLSTSTVEDLNDILATIDREQIFTKIESYAYWLFVSMPGITGVLILVLMLIMIPLSRKRARKNNYERFWYTHMFWLPLLILLSMHGSKAIFGPWTFHWWVILPASILIIEKLILLYETCFSKMRLASL